MIKLLNTIFFCCCLAAHAQQEVVTRLSALLETQSYTPCIYYCDSLIEKNQHLSTAYLWRGKCYFEMGSFTNAIEDMERSIWVNPNLAEPYAVKSLAHFALREYKKSRTDMLLATTLDTANARYPFELGRIEQHMQKWNDAIQSYTQAIRLNRYYVNAYKNRGYVKMNLLQYDKALRDFDSALKYQQSDADVFLYRGLALNGMKRYYEAILIFDRCNRLKPGYADAYFNKGFAYFQLRKFDEAASRFDSAIIYNPNFALAYHHRALTTLERDKMKRFDACNDLQKAMELGYMESLPYRQKYCE